MALQSHLATAASQKKKMLKTCKEIKYTPTQLIGQNTQQQIKKN